MYRNTSLICIGSVPNCDNSQYHYQPNVCLLQVLYYMQIFYNVIVVVVIDCASPIHVICDSLILLGVIHKQRLKFLDVYIQHMGKNKI